MIDFTTFILVLGALQLICTFVGSRSSGQLINQSDYFLASRQVHCFPLAMTFLATQIGGGIILGAANEAYHFGWSVLFYPLGLSLGFAFLACGIGKRLAQFDVATVAQLLETVYRSQQLRRLASLLSIASLFMILTAQLIASRQFLWSIGIGRLDLFIAFWAIVFLYTTARGLRGIIAIDIVQAGFFIIVFAAAFANIFFFDNFSFPELMVQQEEFILDTSKLTGWLLMPLLFIVIEQDMAQRCFAARSPAIVTHAAAWSAAATFFIAAVPISLGILGKMKQISIPEGESALMAVVKHVMNPHMAALVGCAVIMAIVSTAVSLINAISSNITQDFFSPKPNSQGQKDVRLSRWISSGIASAALFFSLFSNEIVDVLIQSYELSVSCFFVAVFTALFHKNADKSSAYASLFCGAAGFILFRFISCPVPRELATLLLSAMGYIIVALWQQLRKPSEAMGL